MTAGLAGWTKYVLRVNCFVIFANAGGKPGDRVTQRRDAYNAASDGELTISGLLDGSYWIVPEAIGPLATLPPVSPAAVMVSSGRAAPVTLKVPARTSG